MGNCKIAVYRDYLHNPNPQEETYIIRTDLTVDSTIGEAEDVIANCLKNQCGAELIQGDCITFEFLN